MTLLYRSVCVCSMSLTPVDQLTAYLPSLGAGAADAVGDAGRLVHLDGGQVRRLPLAR